MDYFLKTKIANWTFPSMLSHYKQHYGEDYNKALRHLKEDLNNIVGSEAFTEKAKAPLSMFLNRFDCIENHNYKSVKSAKRKYRKTDVESEEDESGEDEVDEEDEGERRNAGRKMDFIVGGEAQVYIEDYHDNWVMNGLNISKKFHDFRNHCINMIERTGQEPNFVQELALNGTMWFDDKQRLYFSMKPDEWKEAKSSLKSLYHNSTPTVKYPEIDGIVETLAEDIDEGEKKAEKWYASTTMNENEESKKIVARILLCL
ncbi:hypothetical protein G6F38_011745 [Rhizopus arrhizus]|nr:hypothetical protein G6F38_011745 [Rhizopus arrhizus]